MSRFYGGSMLGILFLTWFARDDTGSKTSKAAVLDLFVYDAINFIVALVATLSGVMNALGWGIVAIYLFFTLGYGYFQFVHLPGANQYEFSKSSNGRD